MGQGVLAQGVRGAPRPAVRHGKARLTSNQTVLIGNMTVLSAIAIYETRPN